MLLWTSWLQIVMGLRPAASRERSFLWMVISLIGFSIRTDSDGVMSFIRAVGLDGKYYTRLLDFFHSSAINLPKLKQLWAGICHTCFHSWIVVVNERPILMGDGIKIGKEGKKMPGVKSLHQESTNNSKAEFIMGHSYQILSLLVGVKKFFAVPLVGEIHEGVVKSNRDKRTLYDKFIQMLLSPGISNPFWILLRRTRFLLHDSQNRQRASCPGPPHRHPSQKKRSGL
jgi:hypothetical protein